MIHQQLKIASRLEEKSCWKEASQIYQNVLQRNPQEPTALAKLAILCSRAGKHQLAITLFQRLSKVRNLVAEELTYYGRALLDGGQDGSASKALQRSLVLDRNQTVAWYHLGRLLAGKEEFEQAAGCFQRVVEVSPEDQSASEALTQCLLKTRHYTLARPVVEKLYLRNPDSEKLALAYAQLLYHTGRLQQTIPLLSSLAEKTTSLQPLLWLAMAYMQVGDKTSFEAVESRILDNRESLTEEQWHQLKLWKSRCYLQIGEKGPALSLVKEVLAKEPRHASAWQHLAESAPELVEDNQLAQLQETVNQEADPSVLGGLYFALGKLLERRGDKAEEVQAYEKANGCLAPFRHYYADVLDSSAAEMQQLFSNQKIRALAVGGDGNFRPVFILSMPRSGTTLLEQVLGSHSGIATAGESTVMDYVLDQRKQSLGMDTRREYLTALTAGEITFLAEDFKAMISAVAESDSPVIVEKGMNNIRDAGLLAAMFPEATFIVLERHPMDVGWGCFKQNFSYQNFSYSYDGIASEFSRFFALKKHWLEHLPKKPFAVRYEDMVLDLRGTVKPLVESCGLAWEEGCLEFQQRRVAVATASMNQVRKGLYSDSLNRWKSYGDLMGPLYTALANKGVFSETDYEDPAL